MLGSVGVTSIVDRVAAVTVSVVLPETPPKVAVIVVIPAATEVAIPSRSDVVQAVLLELQVTWDVTTFRSARSVDRRHGGLRRPPCLPTRRSSDLEVAIGPRRRELPCRPVRNARSRRCHCNR